MKSGLFQGSWQLGTVMGIPIRVHFSWLLVFGLITWSLSTQYFPAAAPELLWFSYWINGLLAALLLFGSVAFHELAHSWVARRYGMNISGITLFIFGGVSELEGEVPNPRAEFRIAVVGPLSSLFLAGLFFLLARQTAGGGIQALFFYLARINLILGIFNLIPGFPMDGGRVLRAAIWSRKKDFFQATRKASGIGQKFGLFLIIFGIFSLFGRMPGGLWLMLIGWFLYTAAQASYQQATLQQSLAGVKVKDIITRDLVTLPATMSLEEAVSEYFLKHGFGGFPVMTNGRFLGFITLKEIKNIRREEWGSVTVSELAVLPGEKGEVTLEDEAMKSLELMIKEDKGRIAVLDRGAFVGMITRNGIARFLQIKKEMAGM
ncbi:MAG: site-2 protease family protein [Deltaproteobacteria bacterium]|nr:site-2 protease family protein [Deltaproteobacteria bacterium]